MISQQETIKWLKLESALFGNRIRIDLLYIHDLYCIVVGVYVGWQQLN